MYLYLSPVGAVLLDVSMLVALVASDLVMLVKCRGGLGGAACVERNGLVVAMSGRCNDLMEGFVSIRGGILHVGVVVDVTPTNLFENVLEGIGLLEVCEGLLGMGHLGTGLGHELDDLVLSVLGQTEVVMKRVNSGTE